jgi:hypothetical protein
MTTGITKPGDVYGEALMQSVPLFTFNDGRIGNCEKADQAVKNTIEELRSEVGDELVIQGFIELLQLRAREGASERNRRQ